MNSAAEIHPGLPDIRAAQLAYPRDSASAATAMIVLFRLSGRSHFLSIVDRRREHVRLNRGWILWKEQIRFQILGGWSTKCYLLRSYGLKKVRVGIVFPFFVPIPSEHMYDPHT